MSGVCAWPGCNVLGRMWAQSADGERVVDVYLCEEHHESIKEPRRRIKDYTPRG